MIGRYNYVTCDICSLSRCSCVLVLHFQGFRQVCQGKRLDEVQLLGASSVHRKVRRRQDDLRGQTCLYYSYVQTDELRSKYDTIEMVDSMLDKEYISDEEILANRAGTGFAPDLVGDKKTQRRLGREVKKR